MPAGTEAVFETHSWSEDNDAGTASGWNHSRLSPTGRGLAEELGERRRYDGISVVLTSDLRRAAETAEIAFADSAVPILRDWRLRECNYGEGNGMPAAELHKDKSVYLDEPYPGGESWRQAVRRCASVLDDVHKYWEGQRVLIIGRVCCPVGFGTHSQWRTGRATREGGLPLAARMGVPAGDSRLTAHPSGGDRTGRTRHPEPLGPCVCADRLGPRELVIAF